MVRGVPGRWKTVLALHLGAGTAAAFLMWGVAIWDAPESVGRWRAALLLGLSTGAGLMGGALFFVAALVRQAGRLGESAWRLVLDAVRRLPEPRHHRGFGPERYARRAARWINGAACSIFALNAVLLYLFLY